MITAFTYCGKFENFTFCIEPLSLHFIVTLPVFNVLSIFPIVPVENVEPPNNANGAYDISLHPSLFIEIVTDFISAPEVLYINKLLKTFLLFNLQNCNFESKITCRIFEKTNGPILSSFYSTYSTSYSIPPPHSIF